MRRNFAFFILHFMEVFQERGRVFVWFLISFIGPLIMLLFWRGARFHPNGWNIPFITSYYILFVTLNSFLMVHMERHIGEIDIQEGELTKYLLKPFSYIRLKFFEEIPYRIIQGMFGIIVIGLYLFIFGHIFAFTNSLAVFLSSFVILLLGFFISYLYKFNVGLLAFWTTDFAGIFHFSEMLLFIFAGYIIPLFIFPSILEKVAYILPFGYMVYFPVISLQGKLPLQQIFLVIIAQMAWIAIFWFLSKFLFQHGVKRFTGIE